MPLSGHNNRQFNHKRAPSDIVSGKHHNFDHTWPQNLLSHDTSPRRCSQTIRLQSQLILRVQYRPRVTRVCLPASYEWSLASTHTHARKAHASTHTHARKAHASTHTHARKAHASTHTHARKAHASTHMHARKAHASTHTLCTRKLHTCDTLTRVPKDAAVYLLL